MIFNRVAELEALKHAYNSGRAELIIVYGRRGTGKTTLIREFLREHSGVYLFTPRGDIEEILASFSDDLSYQLGEFIRFGNFKDFLEFLRFKSTKERFLIVIDEFQRLYDAYKPAMSLFQHYWDTYLRNTFIMLVLVGSAVGTIERIALVGDAPLFGRRTHELRIKDLPYIIARNYWKKYSEIEKIEIYGYFGGTPGYFTRAMDNVSPIENVEQLVLSAGAPLAREPEEILSEETRAPGTYMSILARISRGKMGLPLAKIKVRKGSPTVYLRTLMIMNIVDVLRSLAQGDRIYIINDEFFRFWFRFIYPRQTFIETGRGDLIKKVILSEKDEYLSFTFEKILRELIIFSAGMKIKDTEIPYIDEMGSFWWRNIEVDACAISKDTVIIGEAKWQDTKIDRKAVEKFLAKKEIIAKKLGKHKVVSIMLARNDFTDEARRLENEEMILMSMEELSEHLNRLKIS